MWGSIIESASAGLQAIEGNSAIRNAEKRQQEWQERAMKVKEEKFNQALGYYKPYSEFGGSALDRLKQMNDPNYRFEASSPSYNWRLLQGQKVAERSAAAKGNLMSGGTLKALTDYAQNLASTEYENQWKRNMEEMGIGASADSAKAAMTGAYGDWMAGANQEIGNIQSSAIMSRYRNWAAQDSRAAGAWASYFGTQPGNTGGGGSTGIGSKQQGGSNMMQGFGMQGWGGGAGGWAGNA